MTPAPGRDEGADDMHRQLGGVPGFNYHRSPAPGRDDTTGAGDKGWRVPVLNIDPYRLPADDPDAPSTEAHDPGEPCRYCRHPLIDDQERRWGMCGPCHDDGTRNDG